LLEAEALKDKLEPGTLTRTTAASGCRWLMM
jgi:hypothetical protein